MIITYEHYKSIPYKKGVGYCANQGRPWAKRHNFNWQDFVENGIDEQLLLATKDVHAVRLVEFAKKYEKLKHGR